MPAAQNAIQHNITLHFLPSMNLRSAIISLLFAVAVSQLAVARTWADTTGRYTLDAELVTFSDTTVVLKRADHDLVAIRIEKLSDKDREYLNSQEASNLRRQTSEAPQTWTLRDGTKVTGRVVDYVDRVITLQRRRGRIYVNDRVLENLPEFYQRLVPSIVAHSEQLQNADRRALETWLIRQPGAQRSFHVEGVVLEADNGDEFSLPFFLLSDEDQKLLKPGWQDWLAARKREDFGALSDGAFLLQSLAAARQRDAEIKREIAMMQLKLQAVQTGLTSLWEVTLHPPTGQFGRSQWVVVPGRDSRQATLNALEQFPGFIAGPVRRISGR